MMPLRIGLRGLRRTPAFTAGAVLILGLGIGLATAVFSVAHTLLVRRLPVAAPDRLVAVWTRAAGKDFDWPVSLVAAREVAVESRALERVAWYGYEGAWPNPVRIGDRLTPMSVALVSGQFFEVLGVGPTVGRALRAEDDVAGATPVAVLSHGAWRRYFDGRPDVIGQVVELHATGVSYAIVGVMAPGLDFPRGADLWAAITPGTAQRGDATAVWVNLIGRLRAGLPPTAAEAELTNFFRRPGSSRFEQSLHGVATGFTELIVGDVRPAILAFAAAAGLLLLITCINVANLLLVRGLGQVRDVAIRAALGASRGQVITLLMVENAVLAIGGGVIGVGVAAGAIRALVAVAPSGLPRLGEIGVNGIALIGALAVTAFALLASGLAPAIITSRGPLDQVLRATVRQSGSRRARRTTEALVVGQVALAVLVLVAAGLVSRSLLALQRSDPAFDGSRLLISELTIRTDRFDSREKQLALLDRVVAEVGAVPGVRAVAPVVAVPFSGTGGWDGQPAAEGQTADEASRNPMLNLEVVTPAYFAAVGLAVRRGRPFADADREGAPAVIILSESAARHYWPEADPIGKRLTMGGPIPKDTFTVVGVVPDTRYRELREARPSVYFPLRQSIFPFAPTILAIRTTGRPADLAASIRRAIDGADPAVAVVRNAPFETYRAGPLAQPRLNALLLGLFAGAAVGLAAVGLFAVMAAMVRRRTREIGVRMALGASASDLGRMVVRQGLILAAAGLAIGLGIAVVANRLLATMLYRVSPTDALTLTGVAALVLGVAVAATAVPARASTRVDPIRALGTDG